MFKKRKTLGLWRCSHRHRRRRGAVGVRRRTKRGKCDGSQVLISAFRCDARDSKRRKNGWDVARQRDKEERSRWRRRREKEETETEWASVWIVGTESSRSNVSTPLLLLIERGGWWSGGASPLLELVTPFLRRFVASIPRWCFSLSPVEACAFADSRRTLDYSADSLSREGLSSGLQTMSLESMRLSRFGVHRAEIGMGEINLDLVFYWLDILEIYTVIQKKSSRNVLVIFWIWITSMCNS